MCWHISSSLDAIFISFLSCSIFLISISLRGINFGAFSVNVSTVMSTSPLFGSYKCIWSTTSWPESITFSLSNTFTTYMINGIS